MFLVELILLAVFTFYVFCIAQLCANTTMPVGLLGVYCISVSVFFLVTLLCLMIPMPVCFIFTTASEAMGLIWWEIYVFMLIALTKAQGYSLDQFHLVILFILSLNDGFISLKQVQLFLVAALLKMIHICYNWPQKAENQIN